MNSDKNIQAVILAAGKGTRMLPLTATKPKPMQEVLGKNLIEWKLEALPQEVTDVIIVIGYQGGQIQDYFGDSWNGKSIRYVEQKELNGTAGALLLAKPFLGERFLVMMGDDLYAKEDMERLLKLEWGICVIEALNKEMGGEILVDTHGNFAGIREEKHFVEKGFVNTGLYILGHEILEIEPVAIGGSSTEFGLPHTLLALTKNIPVRIHPATKWLQVTTPEDLVRAEMFLA